MMIPASACEFQLVEDVVADDGFDDLGVEAATQHRRHPQHDIDVVAQPGEPTTDHLT